MLTSDNANKEWSFFHISAGKLQSPERAYKIPSAIYSGFYGKPRIFPMYTAIVTLTEGIVTSISWDDGCYGCNFSALDNGCGDSIMSINSTSSSYQVMASSNGASYYNGYWNTLCGNGCTRCWNSNDYCNTNCDAGTPGCACDLTIYVVFTGTDNQGRYLSSAGLRMSRFQDYSISSLVESAQATVTSALIQNNFA